MRRIFEKLLRRFLFTNHAAVDKYHAVCHFARKAHFVGHNHHRHALLRELFHNVEHLAHHLRVKRTCRLVKQHHVRLHGKRTGDCNALLLAAGKLHGICASAVTKANARQKFLRQTVGIFFLHALHANGRSGHIVEHRHVGKQIKLLEHHADFAAHCVDVGIFGGDIHTFKNNMASGGYFEQI